MRKDLLGARSSGILALVAVLYTWLELILEVAFAPYGREARIRPTVSLACVAVSKFDDIFGLHRVIRVSNNSQ